MSDPLDHLRLPVIPIEPRPDFAAALLRRIQQLEDPAAGRGATVRYFVDDLDAAVHYYRDLLGFEEELRPSPVFAAPISLGASGIFGVLGVVALAALPASEASAGSTPGAGSVSGRSASSGAGGIDGA